MKILAVSDKVMDVVYSSSITRNFGDVDMVIACGDLPLYYLDFIISSLNVPGYFVYGNHDLHFKQTMNGHISVQPPGWVNLDERGVHAQGLWLAGLEGCLRYRPDGVHQCTQNEMYLKALRLAPRLVANRLQCGRYLDILVAHAPPFGIHDGPDYPHIGFKAFLMLMDRCRPRYLLHGHKHVYGVETTRTIYGQTEVLNIYPYRVIEIESKTS